MFPVIVGGHPRPAMNQPSSMAHLQVPASLWGRAHAPNLCQGFVQRTGRHLPGGVGRGMAEARG